MSRSWVAALTAVAVLVTVVDAAAARPGAQPTHKRATHKRATHKRATHKRAAHKRKAARGKTVANMPDGWAWPPTKAMRAAGVQCEAELDQLGIVWKPAAKVKKIATPITVPAMVFGGVQVKPTFRAPPFVMDCHLALALAIHGKELYARGVRELLFSRIYGYTRVRTGGRETRALSRHALGLAIDVRALVDDTGRKAVVLDDYPKDDPLLIAVENYLNDSGGFRTVLTPKNDPESHDDHFHVEARVDYRAPGTR